MLLCITAHTNMHTFCRLTAYMSVGNKLHHLKDPISSGSGQAMIGPNSLFSIEEGTLFLTDPENGATHVAVGSHLQYLADQ